MAIVLSFSSIVHTITDIGIKDALVQNRRGNSEEYVGAAWWISFIRSVGLYSLLFILAPFLATFYRNPQLTNLLRVATLGVLFSGAVSPRLFGAIKCLRFSKVAVVNHGGAVCAVIATIGLTFFVRKVWALAVGYAAESALICLFSFVAFPFLPPLKWDRIAIHDLLRFSRGLFGLSFLNLIFSRIDIFVLARLLPAADVGRYAMALFLVQTPTSFIMNLMGQTLMPSLSQVQDNRRRTNRMLIAASSLLVVLGAPAVVFAFCCGKPLLRLVYGADYLAASPILGAASLVAVVNLLNGQITTVFFANGRPHLHRLCVALMASLMIVSIYPLIALFGMVGGQIGCLVCVLVGYIFQLTRVQTLTGLKLSDYCRIFGIAVAAALLALIGCEGAQALEYSTRPLMSVAAGVVSCLIAYTFAGWLLLQEKVRKRAF
jgi:PST family polysaccharide transporter